MKKIIKRIIAFFVKNDYFWNILNATLVKISDYAKHIRKSYEYNKYNNIIFEAIQTMCPDHLVKHGPFKGMRYPDTKSTGSVLFPKLLGCYEREIQPIIERICERSYTEVIDIGCAEGYYAVGLAMRIPTATIYAFDTNDEAIRMCRNMAQLNNVDKRVLVGSFCDSKTLKTIPFTNKGLIFCDIEGDEKKLFTDEIVDILSKHDLLIEIHDGQDPSISSHVRQLFEKTHKLEAIKVLSDIERVKTYPYKEIERHGFKTRYSLVAEKRRNSTEWFYLESNAVYN